MKPVREQVEHHHRIEYDHRIDQAVSRLGVSSPAWGGPGQVLKLGARYVTATRRPVEVPPTPTDLAQVMDRVNDRGQPLTWTALQIRRARTHDHHRRSLINLAIK